MTSYVMKTESDRQWIIANYVIESSHTLKITQNSLFFINNKQHVGYYNNFNNSNKKK